jgi:hypothetical protein
MLGNPPTRHWVLVVSLDSRNMSERVDSVLIVPFGSQGADGPTTLRFEPGETGLPGPSWLKGHFITTLRKSLLGEQEFPHFFLRLARSMQACGTQPSAALNFRSSGRTQPCCMSLTMNERELFGPSPQVAHGPDFNTSKRLPGQSSRIARCHFSQSATR